MPVIFDGNSRWMVDAYLFVISHGIMQRAASRVAAGADPILIIVIMRLGAATHLKLVGFLQLVGVLVLAVVHLLPLDVGVHAVLLHVRPEP